MAQTRIITDVPQDRVNFVVSLIKFDGGTAETQPEADGQVTIVATFPNQPAVTLPASTRSALEKPWMSVARKELGVQEQAQGSNARIEAYHATTHGGAADDSVPWCSSFVNFCIEHAGLQGTKSKSARSWMQWGINAPDFVPGCVVVLQRGTPPQGHVGFFVSIDHGRINVLGGNQGNAVSIASFDADRVLARRLPLP